jgi:hypothetical protein
VALVLLASVLIGPLRAQEQIVAPDPADLSAPADGYPVSFTLVYDTSNGAATHGLGVSMYFDSSQLAFVSLTNLLGENSVGQTPPQNDSANGDADPSTDQFLTVAWAAIGGGWDDGPKILFDAGFTTTAAFSSTVVRFTGLPTSGYAFVSTPFVAAAGPPSPTRTPTPTRTPSPTPTATPTPSPTATATPTPTATASATALPFALLDIDRNGDVDTLTDGLLVVRYLFGFRNQLLVEHATADDCTVCAADDLEAYIESIRADLDIDADGEADPLIDGLLLMRYLFGFRGAALVDDAVDADCTRCEAPEIEAFIEAGLSV